MKIILLRNREAIELRRSTPGFNELDQKHFFYFTHIMLKYNPYELHCSQIN